MPRIPGIRLLALPLLFAMLTCVRTVAQDDPNEVPLGDVARSLRKKSPSPQKVIDDDNLPQVMQEADSHHSFGSSLKFLKAGDSKAVQMSAPDVTCSLSFTANVKSLLSSQYAQMELPAEELEKLEGPATIEGDALTIPIFNATDWHVSELDVALTVIKTIRARDSALSGSSQTGDTVTSVTNPAFQEVRPEKKPELTVLYRIRAAAPPWARAVFSTPLKIDVPDGDDWHWAIVGAKGYPPQSYAGTQTPSPPDGQASIKSAPVADSLVPHDEPGVSPPQAGQEATPQQ